ncbi:MAG: cation:proton antiporter [Paraburkholderia sp.]|jgi:Kef-type K+ transport system membrane component KefB|uniref:cation:proton antiporter n=3 Tax=Burkholderiales TaxID=80840 RepID=UPI0020181545|nr:cation:proton antiporter [Burkholderia sp. 4M9327F10]
MFLLQLAIVILACHACGHVAERIGQCRVVGEITAGILLGPSVLGVLHPGIHDVIFPASSASSMSQLGEVGIVLLMFEIGMHIQPPDRRAGAGLRLPGLIAALGLVMPFVLGVLVAIGSKDALASGVPGVPYVLFCGVALGVSAVPVMARIVIDLGLDRNPLARTALSAAMLTDVAGWVLLAVVASIAHPRNGALGLALALGGIGLYSIGCVLVTRYAVRPMLIRAAQRDDMRAVFTIVTCHVLISAGITASLGFHSAFGALLPGMLLRGIPAVREQWDKWFGGFIRTVLMPVFFSYAGLHTSISSIDGASAWLWLCVFLGAGFAGKFGGSYLAARICGLRSGDAAFLGSLMNARGLMELIVLSIGLQLGILPPKVYTMLVLFALVTTAMTTPLVRYHMRAGNQPLADPQRKPAA